MSIKNEEKDFENLYKSISNDILKARIKSSGEWYIRNATYYKRWFYILSVINIVMPLAVTVINALNLTPSHTKIVTVSFSAIATLVSSLLILFKCMDKWVLYRKTIERIKRELTYYWAENEQNEEELHKLVYKLEKYMAEENDEWSHFSYEKKDDHNKKSKFNNTDKGKINMGLNFYSLRILRHENQTVRALYIRQFFEFCGICVQECMIEREYTKAEKQQADVDLWLAEPDKQKRSEFSHKYEISILTDIGIDNLKDVLKKIIRELGSKIGCEEEATGIFGPLIEVFIDEDWAVKDFARRCFFKQLSEEKQQEIAQMYYNCYQTLYKWLKNGNAEGSLYMRFAQLNCARKMNEVCRLMGYTDYYKEEMTMEDAEQLSSDENSDSNFSMGKVLAGLCGLKKITLWNEGIRCVEEVLEKEKDKAYMNFLRYIYGHFLEIEKHDYSGAWKQYKEILEISPKNYQALFKKGRKLFREEHYEEAYSIFREVADILEKREELLPVEAEYLYKCLVFCEWINRVYWDKVKEAEKFKGKSEEMLKRQDLFLYLREFFAKYYQDYTECIKEKIKRYHFDYLLQSNDLSYHL